MKVLSLFSGAGGLDLGLIQAGNTVIWANDIDANAVETYKKNIGTHIVLGDIKNIDISKLPKADVVVGGFPCQGFSQANRFRMLDDERNALYKFFYEVIHEKQPYFFIAENVKGILSLGKGGAIKQIISDFEAAGYYTDLHLVNMADYGVPETRQRVIIIGQRHDLGKDLLFKFPIPTHSKEGENGLKRWVTIAEAIDHFPDPDLPNEIMNHEYSKYKVAYRDYTAHRKTIQISHPLLFLQGEMAAVEFVLFPTITEKDALQFERVHPFKHSLKILNFLGFSGLATGR